MKHKKATGIDMETPSIILPCYSTEVLRNDVDASAKEPITHNNIHFDDGDEEHVTTSMNNKIIDSEEWLKKESDPIITNKESSCNSDITSRPILPCCGNADAADLSEKGDEPIAMVKMNEEQTYTEECIKTETDGSRKGTCVEMEELTDERSSTLYLKSKTAKNHRIKTFKSRTDLVVENGGVHVEKKRSYKCWICLQRFTVCQNVKKHILQKHFLAFCALSMDEINDTHVNLQLLIFCPKNCKFVTSKSDDFFQHIATCPKPKLQSEGLDYVEVQNNFLIEQFDDVSVISSFL